MDSDEAATLRAEMAQLREVIASASLPPRARTPQEALQRSLWHARRALYYLATFAAGMWWPHIVQWLAQLPQ